MNTDDFVLAVIDFLNAQEVPYMLVGSLATNVYCVPRSTEDGDIVLQANIAQVARQITQSKLNIHFDPQLGFETVTATKKIVLQIEGHGFEVELFELSDDEHDRARFSRRVLVETMDRNVWIASLEDMIVTKLRWSQHIGREKDISDAQPHRRPTRPHRLALRRILVRSPWHTRNSGTAPARITPLKVRAMSSASSFIPPKKKPSVFWWIAGAFFVLLLLFVFQLLGPQPPLVVSPQTTYIESPLRANGTPNYTAYLLEQYRAGVTPENNAAALIWPALWPGELNPGDYAAVANELGLQSIPKKSESLAPIHNYCREMANVEKLESEQHAGSDLNSAASENRSPEIEQRTDQLCDRVSNQPWTSAELPQFAEWIRQNQKPLDLLEQASHHSQCYFPSPSLFTNKDELLISYLLPGQQSSREAGRALVVRAMWNIGEHHNDEAWRDLLAIHRLGRLVAQGPTLVEQLVGCAIDGIGCDGTTVLLHDGNLSPEQARQVMRDLDSLRPFAGMVDSLDHMERLMFLDTIIQFSHGNLELDRQTMKQIGLGERATYLRHVNIDWNVALRKGNEYFDRYSAAARMADYGDRHRAFRKIYSDLNRSANEIGGSKLVASALNPGARSDAIALIFLHMFLPAADAAFSAQERLNAKLELLHVAAALAVYRADHGTYPTKLHDLVPTIIPKLPVDFFTAKPFVYKRIDDGYLLYSLGPNGADDGGSNEMQSVLEGHPSSDMSDAAADAARQKIPSNSDDHSIRVPRLRVNLSE